MINNPNGPIGQSCQQPQQRQFVLTGPADRGRSAVEHYIREGYQRCYQASLAESMPLLLSLNLAETAQAALGLRPAGSGRLFLESYLDGAIESAIASAAAQPVLRERIVEIGNLIATRRIGSQQLFIVMTAALAAAGFHWMTFTATPQVVKLIARLGFVPLDLGAANPQRLADGGASWGSYYQTAPRLQAGSLSEAICSLNANPASAAQLALYSDTIAALAEQLAAHRLICRG